MDFELTRPWRLPSPNKRRRASRAPALPTALLSLATRQTLRTLLPSSMKGLAAQVGISECSNCKTRYESARVCVALPSRVVALGI